MDNIILVGNPNTGKTTLFNRLTNSNEHIGNWHGVTIDAVSKKFTYGNNVHNIIDLPGVYSLTAFNPEEKVTIDYLFEKHYKVLNICDINNLSHNLYLTLQLLEAGFDICIVVNLTDKKDHTSTINALKKIFCERIAFVDVQRDKDLLHTIDCVLNVRDTIDIDMSYLKTYCKDASILAENAKKINVNKEFAWLKLIENDMSLIDRLGISEKQIDKIEERQVSFTSDMIASARYEFIANILPKSKVKISILDKLLLNRCLAIPIFLVVVLSIFYITFGPVGTFLKDGLSYLVQDLLGQNLYIFMQENNFNYVLTDFVYKGLICGVGGILSFLPQIVLLFFFLSLLEESGYLSRLAFIFDDLFAKIGLSGKSLFTLIMSFGCSTIAMMTARNIEDENVKKKTMILSPYMCCSAKLPIFVILTSVFFGGNFLVIFGLYILTIFVSVLVAILYNRKLSLDNDSFILEFPTYRVPTLRKMGDFVCTNSLIFLNKIGSMLILFSIIFYFLNSYDFNLIHIDLGGISIMQRICELFAPLFAPLGFGDWGAVSALVSGVVAKEIIVGSIGMINGVDASGIAQSLVDTSSNIYFEAGSALSFMAFALLYTPCLSSISVMVKQLGGKQTAKSLVLEFVVAYLTALCVYLSSKIFDFNIIAIGAMFVLIIFIVLLSSKNAKCVKCKGLCADCFLK